MSMDFEVTHTQLTQNVQSWPQRDKNNGGKALPGEVSGNFKVGELWLEHEDGQRQRKLVGDAEGNEMTATRARLYVCHALHREAPPLC